MYKENIIFLALCQPRPRGAGWEMGHFFFSPFPGKTRRGTGWRRDGMGTGWLSPRPLRACFPSVSARTSGFRRDGRPCPTCGAPGGFTTGTWRRTGPDFVLLALMPSATAAPLHVPARTPRRGVFYQVIFPVLTSRLVSCSHSGPPRKRTEHRTTWAAPSWDNPAYHARSAQVWFWEMQSMSALQMCAA